MTPEKFAGQAAVISKAEIELGQLAMQKSQGTQVRNFSSRRRRLSRCRPS